MTAPSFPPREARTARASGRSRWAPREIVSGLALSSALGLVIALFLYLLNPRFFGLKVFVHGVMIGVCIYFAICVLETAFERSVNRLPGASRHFGRGLLYFVGGNVGWFAATYLARELGLWHPRVFSAGAKVIFINGLFAVPVGLGFYGFGVMRGRLRDSIEKLKEKEFAEKELELARSIQQRLLPPPEVEGEGFRVAARNLAARWVAGDFYDLFPVASSGYAIAVADVAGKGIAASLIMASVKAVLPLVAAGRSAEETLRALNEKLVAELGRREFVALAYALYRPAEGHLELANAGLPDPYLLRAGAPPVALAAPGPRLPLGLKAAVSYRSLVVHLEPGDRVLFITDGLPEAPTAAGEPLGYEAFAALLTPADGRPGQTLDELFDRVRHATGSEGLEDDWTSLMLEHVGGSSPARASPA